MKDLRSIAAIAALYIGVMAAGLSIAVPLVDVIYGPGEVVVLGESVPITPIAGDPNDPASSGFLIGYIILVTGILLVLIKLGLSRLIRLFMYLSIFSGLSIGLIGLFGGLGVVFSLPLLLAFIFFRNRNLLILNGVLGLTCAGIGAFIGASFNLFPAALLLAALSAYDLIAVFGTKHMVALAESSSEEEGNVPLMFQIPMGGRMLGLGTGDLVMPLMFAVSAYHSSGQHTSLLVVAGGFLGLMALYFYIQTKKHVTLPALPPLTAGAFIGYAISLIV
ncbi:Signal-peptide peptidase, presenilin aspartyl protease [uncultured archaeon]|nr:Signal-peptide peptidase, presenilin aspartyl protease [uncultured archaeon]